MLHFYNPGESEFMKFLGVVEMEHCLETSLIEWNACGK